MSNHITTILFVRSMLESYQKKAWLGRFFWYDKDYKIIVHSQHHTRETLPEEVPAKPFIGICVRAYENTENMFLDDVGCTNMAKIITCNSWLIDDS